MTETETINPAEIGERWLRDSSLEEWFPFSAERLKMLEAKIFETEKALNYYRSAVEQKRPQWVPSRVRLLLMVTGDGPCASTIAEAGEHDCTSNQWGAISVVATNGKKLGVKPVEFKVVEWRENSVKDLMK